MFPSLLTLILAAPSVVQCTLEPDALAQRMAHLGGVVAKAVQRAEPLPGGVALTLRDDAVVGVVQEIMVERLCCADLRFTMVLDGGSAVRLEVRGAGDAIKALQKLVGR